MDPTIIVAIIAALSTSAGSFMGIIASSKLMTYRLQQLEEKVNKHNGVIERTFALEFEQKNICEKLGKVDDDLQKLEGFVMMSKAHE